MTPTRSGPNARALFRRGGTAAVGMEEIANSCAAESVAPLTRAVIHCVPDNNTTAEAPVETLRQTAPVVPTRKTCTCESLGRTCPHCIRKARWERALKKLKWVTRGLSHEDASFLFPEHWLEAVDTKHRVGSGLNHYFTSWLRSSTTQVSTEDKMLT